MTDFSIKASEITERCTEKEHYYMPTPVSLEEAGSKEAAISDKILHSYLKDLNSSEQEAFVRSLCVAPISNRSSILMLDVEAMASYLPEFAETVSSSEAQSGLSAEEQRIAEIENDRGRTIKLRQVDLVKTSMAELSRRGKELSEDWKNYSTNEAKKPEWEKMREELGKARGRKIKSGSIWLSFLFGGGTVGALKASLLLLTLPGFRQVLSNFYYHEELNNMECGTNGPQPFWHSLLFSRLAIIGAVFAFHVGTEGLFDYQEGQIKKDNQDFFKGLQSKYADKQSDLARVKIPVPEVSILSKLPRSVLESIQIHLMSEGEQLDKTQAGLKERLFAQDRQYILAHYPGVEEKELINLPQGAIEEIPKNLGPKMGQYQKEQESNSDVVAVVAFGVGILLLPKIALQFVPGLRALSEGIDRLYERRVVQPGVQRALQARSQCPENQVEDAAREYLDLIEEGEEGLASQESAQISANQEAFYLFYGLPTKQLEILFDSATRFYADLQEAVLEGVPETSLVKQDSSISDNSWTDTAVSFLGGFATGLGLGSFFGRPITPVTSGSSGVTFTEITAGGAAANEAPLILEEIATFPLLWSFDSNSMPSQKHFDSGEAI